jgi:outer membrane murein-binding lipoprotein Lpp
MKLTTDNSNFTNQIDSLKNENRTLKDQIHQLQADFDRLTRQKQAAESLTAENAYLRQEL